MPGFVKTDADEALWAKAKRAASHAGLKAGTERWYKFANDWFHKHKGGSSKGDINREAARRAAARVKQ